MADTTLRDELLLETQQGNLVAVQSLYRNAEARQYLGDIAAESARSAQSEILEWCFTQGFRAPRSSVNSEFYHAACDGESAAVFQVLVNHRFDLNRHWSEYDGDALVVAAESGNVELMQWLLYLGQDPNLRRSLAGVEAGPWVLQGGHEQDTAMDMLRLMLSYGWRHVGTATFVCAAELGNLEAMQLLLDSGGVLEESGMWWQATTTDGPETIGTGLYRACRSGQIWSVEFLLDRGASPDFRDALGRTGLAVAGENGHTEVVQFLQDRGVRR